MVLAMVALVAGTALAQKKGKKGGKSAECKQANAALVEACPALTEHREAVKSACADSKACRAACKSAEKGAKLDCARSCKENRSDECKEARSPGKGVPKDCDADAVKAFKVACKGKKDGKGVKGGKGKKVVDIVKSVSDAFQQ